MPGCRSLCAGMLLAVLFVVEVSAQDLTGQAAQTVSRLNDQIDTLSDAEKWEEAHAVQLKVLDIYLRELGERNVNTAFNLAYTGEQLYELERYREAKLYYERAIKAYRATVGEANEDYILTQFGYGKTLRLLTELNKARTVLKKALKAASELYGPREYTVVEIVEELGFTELDDDKPEEARKCFLAALKIYPYLSEEDQSMQLWCLTSLATAETSLGNDAAAKEYLDKAYQNAARSFGEDSYEMTEVLLALGTYYQGKSDLATARRHYERVVNITNQIGESDSEEARLASVYLAQIFIDLGDYVTAEQLLTKTYRQEIELYGEDSVQPYYTLWDIGYLYDMQDKHPQARDAYGKVLTGLKRHLSEDHSSVVMIQSDIASVDQLLLHYDEAREGFEGLRDIHLQKYGENSIEFGALLFNLGWLEHDFGNYEIAREYYDQAIKVFENRLGPSNPETLQLKMMRASLAASERKWPEAVRLFDQMIRESKEFYSTLLASLSPTEQLLFLKNSEDLSLMVSVAIANQDDPEVVATTMNWLLNAKGVSQETLAARETLTRDLDDVESRNLAQQLLKIRQELAGLALSRPEEGTVDERAKRITELTQQEETLARQLADRVGEPLAQSKWVELDSIRQALAADQTMINFFELRPWDYFSVKTGRNRFSKARYFAYIIPPTGKGEVKLVDLGESSKIDKIVSKIRSWIGDSDAREAFLAESGEVATESEWQTLFAQAKQKIWDPLAQHFPDETKQLVLSPDGALWLMPWNTIPIGDDRYLIEDYSLRFLTSGRELVLPKKKAAIGAPLLFADPSFDLSPDSVRSAVQSIFRSVDIQKLPAGAISRTAIPQVTPLPSTRLEALAISPSVSNICGKEPIQYLGKFALETVAKEVKSPRVLVLSTHGFFLPEQGSTTGRSTVSNASSTRKLKAGIPENPLLRCGLLLAGCNNPTARGDDGILTGMEILGLDLRGTELVVLSACETGVGTVNSGEGVAGLRQAFQLAGAEAIVSTLWQVPDRDSALLMKDFFEQLAEGKSHPEALRQAQIKRIESRRQRYGAAHPFYWAAWTLTGT